MAFKGIDIRDLWRRGSGMTWRRLHVLLMALPDDGAFKTSVRAAIEAAQIPTADLIRGRQAAFMARNAARLAEEAGNG